MAFLQRAQRKDDLKTPWSENYRKAVARDRHMNRHRVDGKETTNHTNHTNGTQPFLIRVIRVIRGLPITAGHMPPALGFGIEPCCGNSSLAMRFWKKPSLDRVADQ